MASADDVIRDWFDSLWNRGEEDTIDRLLAPHAVVHGLPAPETETLRGRAAFKPFYDAFRGMFPDVKVTIEETIAQGEMVAAHCRVTGHYDGTAGGGAAKGKPVDFWGICTVKVVNGKIVEGWNAFDFLGLYQQLGLLPPPPPL